MKIYRISLLLNLIIALTAITLNSQKSQFYYKTEASPIGINRHKLDLIEYDNNILFTDLNFLFKFNKIGELIDIYQNSALPSGVTNFYHEQNANGELLAYIRDSEVHIIKINGSVLDSTVDIAWQGQYEIHNISVFFEGPGLIKRPDGNYLLIDRSFVQVIDGVTGEIILKKRNSLRQPADIIAKEGKYFLPASSGTEPFIGVVDENGNFLWVIDYENIGNFTGITNLSSGFITVGNRGNDGFLLQLEDYGEVDWLEFFPNTLIYDVTSTKDLGFALVGTKDNKVHLIKTDSLGKMEWEQSYEEGIGWKVIQSDDGGFAIGGRHKDSFSYFIKTDSQGNTNDEIQEIIPNVAILDPNNTRSVFNASGLQFWDDENQLIGENEGHFEVSPNSNTSTIFAGGLWLGGKINGETRVAAQSYASNPLASDFKAGLVGDDTDFFNQIWKVTRTEIDDFLSDLSDNSIDNAIPYNILKYPAKGNASASSPSGISYSINQDLAPFIDVNEDGIYNPRDGDYPKIKGDQMLWWVVSDNEQQGYTGGLPLGVEIYYTAYGFNQPNNPILHNTIFIETEIINTSNNDYEDFYVGQWLDPQIGCSDETLIGSYPEGHFFFSYSRDNYNGGGEDCDFFEITPFESIIPVQTTMLLNQPLSSFNYYQRDELAEIPGMGSPVEDRQHYNLLTGKWKDGTPLAKEDNGYAPFSEVTTYAFSGNPANSDKWSMCSVDSFSVGASVLGSSGPHLLPANGRLKFNVAFSNFENTPHPCPNIF